MTNDASIKTILANLKQASQHAVNHNEITSKTKPLLNTLTEPNSTKLARQNIITATLVDAILAQYKHATTVAKLNLTYYSSKTSS